MTTGRVTGKLDGRLAKSSCMAGRGATSPALNSREQRPAMLLDDTKPLSEQRHPFFGPNEDDWNLDNIDSPDYGKPGVGIVASAVSVWACLQERSVSLGDAAAAFRMPVEAIAQCVEFHPWMYFVGDEKTPLEKLVIEHEGE